MNYNFKLTDEGIKPVATAAEIKEMTETINLAFVESITKTTENENMVHFDDHLSL